MPRIRYAHWEHFEHLAAIGVPGYGGSRAEAFAQTTFALTEIVTRLRAACPDVRVEVACEDSGPEYLLVGWLNAVVLEMATRRMLFGRFEVSLDGAWLRASMFCEPVEGARHLPAVNIKGATLTDLALRELFSGGWLAQFVVGV